MTENKSDNHSGSDRKRVASGAGQAFIGRLGALVEAVSIVAFTWAYGAVTFGLFAVLWSYVKVATAISDVAMTTTLQRFVPQQDTEGANMAVGAALKLSFIVATILAAIPFYFAPDIAGWINAGEQDSAALVTIIRLYVWVLPFWTLVEVATAAIRAQRTFGPEIRVRIFYEQGIRLVAAMLLASAGFMSYGLFAAHLISVVLSAVLALRLVAKYYDLSAVIKAPLSGPLFNAMKAYGFSVMPANLVKKLFSELPVMALNFMLPGAAGAAAGGYYAVARKIASALQLVKLTFEYVLAPLSAEKEGKGDRTALRDMYAFATRLSASMALPLGMCLILLRTDVLATMDPAFAAASTSIIVLVLGRTIEAATGPSATIVEMLGNKMLPAFNSLMGLFALFVCGYYTIPAYGVAGAAFAASIGMNTTAILSLIQCIFLFGLSPYTREFIKPFAFACVVAAFIAAIALNFEGTLPTGAKAGLAIILLLCSLAGLVRYGLSAHDSEALGKFGKLAKGKGGN